MAELRNDGPEVAEACDYCTHPWTVHHAEQGCLHDWLWDHEGLPVSQGCLCRLAHTGVASA